MRINGNLVRLGKRPVHVSHDRRKDSRILQFSKYRIAREPGLPPVPVTEASWITKLVAGATLGMYLNDQIGDCVEAAAAHMIQQWTYYAGDAKTVTDADVVKAYSDVGGYVPGDPSTDNGTDMFSFLQYWQNTGLGGHKIIHFLAVNWQEPSEVQDAIQLFGNLYTGLGLPTSAQGQNDWTVPDGGIYGPAGQPYGWGGHCVPFVASSPITETCETWGTTLKASKNFFHDYVDEAFVVLSQDWISANGLSPSLLNLPLLESDLNELGVRWTKPKR